MTKLPRALYSHRRFRFYAQHPDTTRCDPLEGSMSFNVTIYYLTKNTIYHNHFFGELVQWFWTISIIWCRNQFDTLVSMNGFWALLGILISLQYLLTIVVRKNAIFPSPNIETIGLNLPLNIHNINIKQHNKKCVAVKVHLIVTRIPLLKY